MESHSLRVHTSCYTSFIQPCICLGQNENRTRPQVLPTFQDKRLASVALLPDNTLVWKSEEESENTVPLCLTAAAFGSPLSTFFGILMHFAGLASMEIVSLISVGAGYGWYVQA